MDKCPICLNPNKLKEKIRFDIKQHIYFIKCKVCGDFKISETATEYMYNLEQDSTPRHIISGIVRNRYESGDDLMLTPPEIGKLLDSTSLPSEDPFEKIDLLLKYLYKKTNKSSDTIKLETSEDYPILYLEQFHDFLWYIKKAKELELIEEKYDEDGISSPFLIKCQLSLNGWRRIAELKKTEIKSNQTFVAMWFDPSLDKFWEEGFKPALKETGFNPIRIDLVEHNEKICDRIIAEIRRSGLLVADFTGQRPGVYFEAGFAMGLGIPVIRTCRDTDIDLLHFDTRQYNHIVWSDAKDLKEKLINRIEATMPIKDFKSIDSCLN